MKKQYWTIIQPDGRILLNAWWKHKYGRDGAWHGLYLREKEDSKTLMRKGWRVVKCWVEIEGMV